jgi:2-hydroxychromene-2-carboxylate isomerase
MLDVTLFWSFRSPYSYIVLPRVVELQRRANVNIDLRIVHPAAIRNPSYFKRMDPLARPYFFIDTARAAAFHGLPFRRPVPDPIVQNPVTLEIAPQNPLAHWLGRLGIAAVERGKGLEFALEVSKLLWDGTTENWHEGNHMANAARRSGLDLNELQRAVSANVDHHEEVLAANDQALRAAGHWGVPTMVFNGEPFFGQDRFDMLVWRLEQSGCRWEDTE